ncbi:MAG: hypothetical protein PHS49_06085 [Candidatus Gracilibacteria bacterium]|nr:hypothetical protein [Candidatus Gracilibacteria bacterium]
MVIKISILGFTSVKIYTDDIEEVGQKIVDDYFDKYGSEFEKIVFTDSGKNYRFFLTVSNSIPLEMKILFYSENSK